MVIGADFFWLHGARFNANDRKTFLLENTYSNPHLTRTNIGLFRQNFKKVKVVKVPVMPHCWDITSSAVGKMGSQKA